MDQLFHNPTQGYLTLDEVVVSVTDFVNKEPNLFYRLIIGSDSHAKKEGKTGFLSLVTAIVIHREGKGGRYYWLSKRKPKPHTLREKIYTETFASLELARILVPKIRSILNGTRHYELEIHIDVGKSGDTRDMIKELVGMVNGNGFIAKTKPESYGASKVADKHA